ncbi:tyrosine-type recombinase/integrase [Mesobacillus foraminis]|uniref:Phage integrase family protein with SAM-like domain n=1 Tax=Mesobacillus foraminis TaxID=279826 RepID=A0A4R2AYK4_9BACI|nr:site-specific integrase [Mesobacillus foraminis]TCN18933.1 phage integrase family protein with SAM-like domain [Mesobacillus foraminis]
MNYLTLLSNINNKQYLENLADHLHTRNLLDENRNLTLAESSEQDVLELFFLEKVFHPDKQLSPHTVKAYRSNAKTLLHFFADHFPSLRDIGFPEVKAYNRFIKDKYAAKTAIRKLEFFRRLLDFGYETQFYKAHLSTWITKPVAKKGHYLIEETRNENSQTLVQVRELSQKDAEYLISFFPKTVKAARNREQLEKRNLLIGYMLYPMGLRASELLSLNWGSFRYNRKGHLYADVIGKGNKPRTGPIREETEEILFKKYWRVSGDKYGETSPVFFAMYIKTYPLQIKIG